MTISADEIVLLNKMNSTASAVQLGTLIANAESVAASEIGLAEGSLLIGNSSTVGVAIDVKGSGKILIGNGTTATSAAVSGDITLSSAGVVAIASGVIVNADVNASAAIDFSKLATLTSTYLLVGSAGNVATAVAVTGDVTIGNTGVTAIGAGKVLLAMLGTGVRPSHIVKYGGTHTTAGGDADEVIVATGAVAGDLVSVSVRTLGTGSRSVIAAVADTDAINVTMSGDPSTNHVLEWRVHRAAA